jgi:uncharacterized alkaline shock family protein YloU
MGKKFAELGDLRISHDCVAELAGLAALECYGVVGMAHPSLTAGVVQILSRDKLKKGVKVLSEKEKIKIQLYVVVEYGVNLVEVARNLIERVKYEVKKHTGIEIQTVDVFVQGIKKGK